MICIAKFSSIHVKVDFIDPVLVEVQVTFHPRMFCLSWEMMGSTPWSFLIIEKKKKKYRSCNAFGIPWRKGRKLFKLVELELVLDNGHMARWCTHSEQSKRKLMTILLFSFYYEFWTSLVIFLKNLLLLLLYIYLSKWKCIN